MTSKIFRPCYMNSWALIIGIDEYQKTTKLEQCVSDANAVTELLVDELDFVPENITTLLDSEATAQAIKRALVEIGDQGAPDDRLIVFFAGHGATFEGARGANGYLVPVEGDPGDRSSLVRMDYLLSESEHLPQKHAFFIIDACFSGLAFNRHAASPGRRRFVRDMMRRYSRQLIAAGKADEPVDDGGGPMPGHSVFAGHLIQAVQGKAVKNNHLTAVGLMNYLYSHVSQDYSSSQTPHYGSFDGDGDMILIGDEIFVEPEDDVSTSNDELIEVVPADEFKPTESATDLVENVAELLGDPRQRVKLHGLAMKETGKVIAAIKAEDFPLNAKFSNEELQDRVKRYEKATKEFLPIVLLTSYWGTDDHTVLVERIVGRLCDVNETKEGKRDWLALRWHPVLQIAYASGIAAISSRNYQMLAALLLCKTSTGHDGRTPELLVETVGNTILELKRNELFKRLPGFEKKYTPVSEYLFKQLQPAVDDTLFLGKAFERAYDCFEVMLALCYIDIVGDQFGRTWAPVGRFGYKVHSTRDNPLQDIMTEASREGDQWEPLKAGLFGGKTERFEEAHEKLTQFATRLDWF